MLGLSSVVLILDPSADVMTSRQMVQERLSRAAATLPAVARPPVMLSPLSSLSRVMKIGLTSETLSQVEMSTLAKWTIRPRLMAIPGVANVAIWGQRDRQIQVLVDPDRLQAHGVTVDDVVKATGEAVSLQAGGFLDTPNQRLAITHAAAVQSARDLEGIVVASRNGAALRIGDVATVVEGFPQPIGDAVINSGPGLLLIVEKQLGANTLQVTRDVEAALAALKPALAGVAVDPAIFRPATFIEMSLRNLSRALLVGCVLVIVVLLVFLADWRTALISSTAIPLSLLAAGLLLHYRGGTLDTMVLAGLVIALGEVVDDAIIDVENIVRRLRLNRQAADPAPAIRVVLDASMEVRSAVLYGSLIVVVVFVPVFMLDGLAGAFFRPLALSYVLAILASLAVALTVTPALALLLLPKHLDRRESRLVVRAQGALPANAARVRRSAEDGARFAGRDARAHGGDRAVSRRGVPAELSRVRLPDALGREAGHVARGDAPDHRARQPRADGGAGRPELRRAHRPGRSRRRGRRAELHRAVDQPRSVGRLRGDRRKSPVDRRRIPRPLSRPADLPARADQGGADRRERHHRRPRLRAGARAAASAGAGGPARRSRTSTASPT